MSTYLSEALYITGGSLYELNKNSDLEPMDIYKACEVIQVIIDGLVEYHGDIDLNDISPAAKHTINNANTWLLGHAEDSAERRKNAQTIQIHKTAS